MTVKISKHNAAAFKRRPDFVRCGSYGKNVKKTDPGEVGYYFDEVKQIIVRVVIDPKLNERRL